jgi:CDP-glycerol glycerophosphotransferase (TagB/SpsB family)
VFKFNLFQKKYFKALSNKDQKPDKFIFFPLQMTPESSINTLESYFIDQLKLIDLIRLNMPHNFFLLVKEHPVMIGERKSDFYGEINKKSGVLLVNNNLSTKELIKKASLIITITGTVGLEAYLDDRKTLMFGPTFFSHLCDRYKSYENIKTEIFNAIHNEEEKTSKVIEIAKIMNISYDFILHDPLFYNCLLSKSNIYNFLYAVKNHINRLENT